MPEAKNVGPVIKTLRNRRGWTQEKLAEVAKLGVRTVQRIEGESTYSLDSLRMVARALETSVECLLEEAATLEKGENSEALDIPIVQLPRLQEGRDLLHCISGAHMYRFDHPQPATGQEQEALGAFFSFAHEMGEIWDILDPVDHVRAHSTAQEYLDDLHDHDLWVFGTMYEENFPAGSQKTIKLPTTLLVVRPMDDPRITTVEGLSFLPCTLAENVEAALKNAILEVDQ